MYDLLRAVSETTTAGSGTSSVKVALITAVAAVIAGGIAAFATLRNKDKPQSELITSSQTAWSMFNAELTRRAVAAELLCTEKDTEIQRYRDMLWEMGQDPDKNIPAHRSVRRGNGNTPSPG